MSTWLELNCLVSPILQFTNWTKIELFCITNSVDGRDILLKTENWNQWNKWCCRSLLRKEVLHLDWPQIQACTLRCTKCSIGSRYFQIFTNYSSYTSGGYREPSEKGLKSWFHLNSSMNFFGQCSPDVFNETDL